MNDPPDSIRVLIVDDESDLLDVAAALLERESERLSVVGASSAQEGLEFLDDEQVDCVVSDYDMPDLDGIEFLESVRRSHGELPFVLHTGKGSEEVASEAVSKGVTEYLQKEASRSQYTVLANRIETVVDGYRSERALAERNRRLETLISNLPGVVYRCRNERTWPMDQVEGECEELTGYTASALEADEVQWGEDVVHPADQEGVWDAVQDALDRNESFQITYRIRTKAGDTKWVWERGRGVLRDDGKLTAIEGFVTDVTERRERELAIEALQRATEDLLAAGSEREVATIVAEASKRVLGFTNAAIRLLSSDGTRLEPVAVSDPSRVAIEDRPAIPVGEGLVGEAFAEGSVVTRDDIGGVVSGQDYRDARSLLTVPIGEHGTLTAVDTAVGAFDESAVDLASILATNAEAVLDRIDREEELERNQSLLAAVIETSIDGIHVVDADRNIVTYNQRFVDMWEIPDGAIESKSSERALESVLDMVEDPDGFVEKIHYLYEHPEEESRDRVFLKDGRVFDRYSAPVSTRDDARYGRVWFYRNITETIERERELERQNERLDEFVGVISHDLRGPLNVAQGRLAMVSEECDSEYLPDISNAHDRMVTLIENLLTLAREGRSVGETTRLDLRRVVERAWDVVETREATLSVETQRTVAGDESRLLQLFENLFWNAVEHGGDACSVCVGDLGDRPGFFVEDDGPGLRADDPETPFDSGYSTGEHGTGFGLTIVKQIAEAHGWEVTVTDGAEGGARFEFDVDARS